MSMLTRWNPFKTTAPMTAFPEFEDLFRNFGMRPLLREMEAGPNIRIEVSETEAAYAVKADIPGVKKEDISITIDGNQISISAEVKREDERKDENQVYNERFFGRAQRAFSLPMDVDQDKAEAKYDNGVLHLMLPKNPHGTARKIMLS